MLSFGKNITQVADTLQKIEVQQLFDKIAKGYDNLPAAIEQLRTLQTIDLKKYRQMKTTLPYFTCGVFNPPIRRTENFASILYFVLDIDHLAHKGFSVEELKNKLKQDNQVLMLFTSPGGDGLKALFRLKEKCFEYTRYSMFYRVFAMRFSQQHNLEQIIDQRTCDVTRACFLSFDPQAYLNFAAEEVNLDAYMNFEDLQQVEEVKQLQKEAPVFMEVLDANVEPAMTDEALLLIKQKLGVQIRLPKEKNIVVSEEVGQLVASIKENAEKHGIKLLENTNIHYGKKLKFGFGLKWAEINVFHGKKGYSAVITPKGGSSKELAEIALELVVMSYEL